MSTPQAQRGTAPASALAQRLASLALLIAGLALIILAVVQIWQVFARYVLNQPPAWTEPVAVLLMNVAMMLSAASAVQAEAHFGFFIGLSASPPRLRRVLLALSRALQCGVGLLFLVWGARLAAANWDASMAGLALPQGAVFLPLCLGGLLVALFAAERLALGGDPYRGAD